MNSAAVVVKICRFATHLCSKERERTRENVRLEYIDRDRELVFQLLFSDNVIVNFMTKKFKMTINFSN